MSRTPRCDVLDQKVELRASIGEELSFARKRTHGLFYVVTQRLEILFDQAALKMMQAANLWNLDQAREARQVGDMHAAIAAMDLFTVPTATLCLLYCFVIGHDRRRILHFNATRHSTNA
jgi:hypothetical protein